MVIAHLMTAKNERMREKRRETKNEKVRETHWEIGTQFYNKAPPHTHFKLWLQQGIISSWGQSLQPQSLHF
jgi:hypothetical protein